jgi:hypothetical protein
MYINIILNRVLIRAIIIVLVYTKYKQTNYSNEINQLTIVFFFILNCLKFLELLNTLFQHLLIPKNCAGA